MQPIEIFPQNIFQKSNLGLDKNYLNKLHSSIELMRRGDVNGTMISNVEFGWQSKALPQTGPFENLTQKIIKEAYSFCKNLKNFNFSKIEFISLWANINYPNDINWPHTHDGDIAGVYYVDVHENCGDLILDSYSYNLHNKLAFYLASLHKKIITPHNDLLVLFDSNCWHSVTKNKSNKTRISMSFNLKIYD
jgi:uncharacterized protein (TIGR02466 family)